MQIVELKQGSSEWLQYRATKFNASDAPAMMGASKYKSRNELLREMSRGFTVEVDAKTQEIFNAGHRFEALARSIAEVIIGEDLAPVVGYKGDLSSSFDGITLMENIIWEHKTLNNDIKAAQSIGDLHPQYAIQMEQQLLVSGAEKCLFHATKWNDNGDLIDQKHFWYESDSELRESIIAGWEQFKKDLESYTFVEVVEPPKVEAIKDLPAVTIQVRGELTLSNLGDVTPLFDKFLAEAKTVLVTDDDFAIAEAEAKLGRETAKRCKLTAKAVVDQISTVSEAVKTLELYAEKFDKLALLQEKAVKEQKETRKAAAKLARDTAYSAFIVELEKTISPIRLVLNQADKPDFAGAMKNQRTLDSLNDKLDTELARAKIAASSVSNEIYLKLKWYKEVAAGYGFLFNDLQQIIYKSDDDFKLLVSTRIEQHKQVEVEKLEAQRQQIAAEEKAKAEREAAEKLKAELAEKDRIAAQEAAKAQREAVEREQVATIATIATQDTETPATVAKVASVTVANPIDDKPNLSDESEALKNSVIVKKPTLNRVGVIAVLSAHYNVSASEVEQFLKQEFKC